MPPTAAARAAAEREDFPFASVMPLKARRSSSSSTTKWLRPPDSRPPPAPAVPRLIVARTARPSAYAPLGADLVRWVAGVDRDRQIAGVCRADAAG